MQPDSAATRLARIEMLRIIVPSIVFSIVLVTIIYKYGTREHGVANAPGAPASVATPVRQSPATPDPYSPWLHGGDGCYRLDDSIAVFVTPRPASKPTRTAAIYEVHTYDVLVTHAPSWTPVSVAPAYDGRDRTGPSRLLRQSWQVVFRTPTGALRSYEVSPWDHLAESGVELRCAPVGCTAPVLEVAP